MKNFIVLTRFLLALLLTACSNSAVPVSTPVPVKTLTAIPTQPATLTPTNTPLPPTETPAVASEWAGIPVMPGATAGDGDEESYVFTIKATPQQVQEYYGLELGKLGWKLSTRMVDGASLTLTFTRDASTTFTVNIIAKGEAVLVLLVK